MIGYGNSMFLATHGILARTASGGGVDPDAQAFITAASITDPTQQSAINQLVVDLKGYNIWTKMKALYPFVGGTSTSTSYNLKNTSQYQISWGGGVTWASTGVKGNGMNGFGSTGFFFDSTTALNSHISTYIRTNSTTLACEFGSGTSGTSEECFIVRNGSTYINNQCDNSTGRLSPTVTDGRGLILNSRTANNNWKTYRNGSALLTATNANTYSGGSQYVLNLFRRLQVFTSDLYSDKETAFASIGDSLTDTEAANFYTAVQTFQTTLGRQVGTPIPFTGLLDNYSGSSAAYSLRKLRTAYSGSAIRVRRSSDNTEQDFGFVNNVLDTASLLTFCGAGSGFVTTWYDQSGNANNFTSTTAVNQPQIVSLGVVTASSNGLPSVNFGGSTSTYFLNSPTNFLNNTATPISMFNTWRVIDYTNSNSGVFGPSTTNSVGLEILQISIISRRTGLRINNVLKNDNSGATYQLWNDNTSTNTSLILTSSSTAAYKNGSAVTLTNSTGIANLSSGVTSYSMGRYAATNYMAGDIQEIVFYNLDQSSNRAGIESNINAYYGIY